ncbi:sensor histidine kinase [Sulfitobacter aestuariivivens]|uniref:histidine kinase n=1 Tax=Sulfitobacter aestuariivivens TaxID=2766981 RepID=A0A927D3L7_9RHOB|nr:PAS domain-containing sensor histidine kinase [Sulfitobacter aestuariivivens]MBD3663771.1 PAS domain-containing sensor histidine kinase [Sulfitobacter aestuariivivens]
MTDINQITNKTPTDATPEVNGFDQNKFLRQMINLTPGILYIFNHQSQSNEYANRSIAELLGYSQNTIREMGDALLGQVIHPDDVVPLSDHFTGLGKLPDGETSSFEYRAITRQGTTVWLRSYDAVFDRMPDGEVLRHIGVANDITLEKEASFALTQSNAELEQRVKDRTRELAALAGDLEDRVAARTRELVETNEELEQMTYIATHDLKMPISNICRLAEMLLETRDDLDEEAADLVDLMKRASDQALYKVDALVEVARARSDDAPNHEIIEFEQALCATRELLQNEIAAHNAEVVADFSAAPQVFYGLKEVESIFDNLVGNALKYRRTEVPPRVSLRSWIEAGRVHLCVSDNGTGLTLPEDEEKVFGLFRRAHKFPEGNGVALHTIRKRLLRSGGGIDLSSQLGKGTTFTATFPIGATDHAAH